MEFNKQNIQSKVTTGETHVIDEGLRAYMLKVYNYMASGYFSNRYCFIVFVQIFWWLQHSGVTSVLELQAQMLLVI